MKLRWVDRVAAGERVALAPAGEAIGGRDVPGAAPAGRRLPAGPLVRAAPELAALVCVTVWGINFSFQKAALAEIEPLAFTFVRYVGMLALAWGVLLWRNRDRLGTRARGSAETRKQAGTCPAELPNGQTGETTDGRQAPRGIGVRREDLPQFALAGVLGFSIYIVLSAIGLGYTTAFSNALLIATAPVYSALLLLALRLERIGGGQWLGMGISGLGVGLFVADKAGAGFGSGSLGDLISLAAALAFGAYGVANKPLLARYDVTRVMAYTLTIGAVPVLLLALPFAQAQDWGRVSGAAWAGLIWAIGVPVYAIWALWGWAMARAGVGRVTIFMYLVPIAGGLASWLLLGEAFGPLKLTGAALTLGGLAVARR